MGHIPAISFMTVAELLEGAVVAGWGSSRRKALDGLLSQMLVLHSTDSVCRLFAEIRAQRRAQPIAVADALIAATALAFGIELVSHNSSDFRSIAGLTVITEAP
jgi:predicted nucleic acid-binding protein